MVKKYLLLSLIAIVPEVQAALYDLKAEKTYKYITKRQAELHQQLGADVKTKQEVTNFCSSLIQQIRQEVEKYPVNELTQDNLTKAAQTGFFLKIAFYKKK